MILLILFTIFVYTNEKSISTLHEADDKAKPSDSLKNDAFDDFEHFVPPSHPQPRTSYRIDFTKQNGTEIVADRRTIFEVIPADYVCEFCLGVIKKLKERQSTEPDFEQNMKEECWKHNGTDCDDGNVCELINKVALDRLRNDDPEKICIDEKICPDKNKEIKEQQEKERKEKEQEANRKHEEEERKKAEEIEKLKTEASKIEYEKWQEEEKKKNAEKAKLARIHSETGDEEYVVDEVSKAEDEKNDYLDHAPEKVPQAGNKALKDATAHVTPTESNAPVGAAYDEPHLSFAYGKLKTESPPAIIKPASSRVIAVTRPRRINPVLLDRTVELKLHVDDHLRR
ncbi:hypothetical protein V3C99_010725 [Haemonchus contortus]